MLYTIIPMDLVYSADGSGGIAEESVMTIQGRQTVCRKNTQGQWQIERLLSTDPNDYLDPRWQPGTVIRD